MEQKQREKSEAMSLGEGGTVMGKMDDEIITRISPSGEVEYGIPIRQVTGEIFELVAEIEGMSFDEAVEFLLRKGIEKKMREYPEQIRQQIDAILKSTKRN